MCDEERVIWNTTAQSCTKGLRRKREDAKMVTRWSCCAVT